MLLIAGKPLPRVSWYLNDHLLDDTYQQTYEGTVKNALTVREEGGRMMIMYSCNEAGASYIYLDITLPCMAHSWWRLRTKNEPFMATCSTRHLPHCNDPKKQPSHSLWMAWISDISPATVFFC